MRYLIAVLAALAVAAPAAHAGTISGTVKDSSGTALGGVTVNAVRTVPLGLVDSTTTAAGGTYTLADIPDGPHAVLFAFGDPILIRELYDDVGDLAQARFFDVTTTSAETGIDATLDSYPRLRGTVSGPEGPIAGARVSAVSSDGSLETESETTTDSAGAYDFYLRDLSAGSTPMRVQYEGPPGSLYVSESRNLSPAPGSTTTLDAELTLGGGISGRLTDTEGSLFDSGWVSIARVGEGFSSPQYRVSPDDGSYDARRLPPGDYQVLFTAYDPNTTYQQLFDGKAIFQEPDPVRVVAGEVTASVDGRIARLGGITGTVTDGTNPLRNVQVSAFRADGTAVDSDFSEPDGRYTIRLEPGSYRVRFEPDTVFARRWYDDEPTIAAAEPVTVAGSAVTTGIDAAITGGQVAGRVSLSNGDPVNGFVKAIDADGVQVARSSIDGGSYRIAGLLPGVYRLDFSAGETLPESRSVTVAGTETTTVDVVLSRGAILREV